MNVDGRLAASFDKHSLAEYMRRTGQRITLTFTRNGRETVFTFTLERLV